MYESPPPDRLPLRINCLMLIIGVIVVIGCGTIGMWLFYDPPVIMTP
ncbi:MAG TPA: hypothetical protein VGE07_07005 [Herpetosiphonaceae bacterium]